MKTAPLLALFFFTLGNTWVEAQKLTWLSDTTQARKWYQQALTLKQKGNPDSAYLFLQKAAIIYQKNKLWRLKVSCSNEITRTLLMKGKYKAALQNALIALQESQTKLKKVNFTSADALHVMGIVQYYQGNYDKALQYYQQGLQLKLTLLGDSHPSISSSYNNIGIIYYRKGDFTQALEYFNKDLQVCLKTANNNRLGIGASYGNIGNVYFDKGDYEQALTYTQKALQFKQEALGEFHPDLASTYNSLGNIYSSKGELDKALEYNFKALYLWQQALGEAHPNVAAAYNNIGTIYEEKGEYEKATDYYQKNLQILLKSFDENHPDLASVYHNLGTAYTKQKKFELALQNLQKAWHIRRLALGEQHDDVADSYMGIGNVYCAKGEYDKALDYYQTNVRIVRQTLGQKNPTMAVAYNALGSVYLAKKNYPAALRYYQRALVANIISFQDTVLTSNPILGRNANIYLDGSYLLTSLQSKAEILEEQFTQSHAIPDLQLAYRIYCTADTLMTQIQHNYSRENDKVAFTKRTREIYQSALPLSLELYQLTKDKIYLEKAFYFAERGKALVLSATLAESKAKTFAGIADSLLLQDQLLRSQIANYSQQIAQQLLQAEAADSAKLQHYQTLLFTAHRQQENLISKLEKEYPQYYNLKYRPNTVASADMQKLMDEKTAVLEYVVCDSFLHVFTLTRQNFELQSLPIDSTFHRKIVAFRQAILNQEEDLYQQVAYSLFKILLPASLPKSIQRLLIIPEGELTTLPFEALLTRNKRIKSKFAPYLLNKYAISYAYSARLHYERLTQSPENTQKHLLALAPIFADSGTSAMVTRERPLLAYQDTSNDKNTTNNNLNSSGFAPPEISRGWLRNGQYVSPLPASKREVESIAQQFEQRGNSATIYLNNQAQEEQLKSSDITHYNYLHLATHGMVNEDYPELSGLLLAQDSTSAEDGILYLGEIYNLRLKAELVTLSACETGLGKLANGEGVIGLTRALLYAGARNVVVSFWKVPDTSTADLMENFYAAFLTGQDKAQALQTAKRKMARNQKYNHPFYWAPFVLVGK
ncbi:CHAT domain-containing protein [Adhaeribacter radiodurans]|uniref:CHAT domain-containing protein n=1 Tax=Adhaeribacter radiodurans TaxID=2745197 RepID=A0A7L7L6A6_9BACT|nr:CHAT domain-containing protein [Adhaeribacter radiodurans]QMU28347.1 CHAT domain-containing protein [Adhaeribacter radiodurans]